MYSVFSIICIFIIIIKSNGNPVYRNISLTDVENFDFQSIRLCNQNVSQINQTSLLEVNFLNIIPSFI